MNTERNEEMEDEQYEKAMRSLDQADETVKNIRRMIQEWMDKNGRGAN